MKLMVDMHILTGILIALDGGGITFKLNDLTDKLVPTDLDELVHFRTRHVLSNDHYCITQILNKKLRFSLLTWSSDLVDSSVLR